jgi:hypothetical protein
VLRVQRARLEPEYLGGVPELPHGEVHVEGPVLPDLLMQLVTVLVAEMVVLAARRLVPGRRVDDRGGGGEVAAGDVHEEPSAGEEVDRVLGDVGVEHLVV